MDDDKAAAAAAAALGEAQDGDCCCFFARLLGGLWGALVREDPLFREGEPFIFIGLGFL